jgi:hypothetical protein
VAYMLTAWQDWPSMATPLISANLGLYNTAINDLDIRASALEAVGLNVQNGSYTLVLSDANKAVEINSASAVNLTVPPHSSVAFTVGIVIEIVQFGTGQVTLVPGSGVSLYSANGLKSRAQYSAASLRKRAANEWIVTGDLVS